MATCPNVNKAAVEQECESLGASALAVAAAAANAALLHTTHHSCSCAPGGWNYTFADGTSEHFSGCANPDGDPLGSWCAVNPEECGAFAGEMQAGADPQNVVSYDYCTAAAPVPDGSRCLKALKEFDQCGGKSKCNDWACADAAWPGACCPTGLSCERQNAFYWQCLSPNRPMPACGMQLRRWDQCGGSSGCVLGPEVCADKEWPGSCCNTAGGDVCDRQNEYYWQCKPADALDSEGGGATNPIELTPGQQTPGSTTGGGGSSAAQPGKVLYTTLRVAYDFNKLAGSPEAAAAFKADVAKWLSDSAAAPGYLYSAGGAAVLSGPHG